MNCTQLFDFSTNYLSTILYLNILLSTASGIFLVNRTKCSLSNILFFLSLISSVLAIILIMYSYKGVFDFLLTYKPNVLLNIKKPFKVLDIAFWLDMLSLAFIALAIFWRVFPGRKL